MSDTPLSLTANVEPCDGNESLGFESEHPLQATIGRRMSAMTLLYVCL